MINYVFNGDATVTDVTETSFTATIDDPDLIVVAAGSRARSLTVTVEMDEDVAVPAVVGQTLRVSTRLA